MPPTIGASLEGDVGMLDTTKFTLQQSTGSAAISDAFSAAAAQYRRNAGGLRAAFEVTLPRLIAGLGLGYDRFNYRVMDPNLLGRDFGRIRTNWYGVTLALHAGKYDGPWGIGGGGSVAYGAEVFPKNTVLDVGAGDVWIVEKGDDKVAALAQLGLSAKFYAELSENFDFRLQAGWRVYAQPRPGGLKVNDDGAWIALNRGLHHGLFLTAGGAWHTPR